MRGGVRSAPRAVDVDHPVAHDHRDRRRALDDGRLGARDAAVAEAAEDARLEDEVAVVVGHVAQELPGDDRLDRLVVDGGGDRDRPGGPCRDARRRSDRSRRSRPAWGIGRRRVSRRNESSNRSPLPFRSLNCGRPRGFDAASMTRPSRVDRQPARVGHHVQRRGVGQVQRRAAVAQRRDGLELDRERIGRAGRQLPVAARERGIDRLRAWSGCRRPTEVRFQNESRIGSSRPVAEIDGVHRDPGDASLGEAGREVVAAAGVGDGDRDRRAAARRRGGAGRARSWSRTLRRRSQARRCCCA